MMTKEMPGLGRGERAPDFVLPLENGSPTRFYAKAGGSATLLIFDTELTARLPRFSQGLDESVSGVPIFAVKPTGQKAAPQEVAANKFAIPVFLDVEGKVRTAYRLNADEKTVVFVLDPNLRVLAKS